MRSQWECLLQNLGEWQGSFTRFSPQGKLSEDTPTVVSLAGLNHHQTIRQIIRRCPPNQPVEEKVLEYSSLGRGVLFFDNGAFSQGSIQFSPFSTFGAELGLIDRDRRLRLVQLFDKAAKLEMITLIREHLAGTVTTERPPLTVTDLIGEWQGEGVTIYPDRRSPEVYLTTLQVQQDSDDQLTQRLTINSDGRRNIDPASFSMSSTAKIQGSNLYFNSGSQHYQLLLLPDGASSTSPQQINPRQAFFLEVGWLLQPHLRQRLIRWYDAQGEWSNLTLVTEKKAIG